MADSVFDSSSRPTPEQVRAGPEGQALARGQGADFGALPDSFCRRTAVLIERDFPQWLVMWGPYSREFLGLPLIQRTPGKILRIRPIPNELTSDMRAIQMSRASGVAP